MWEEEAGAFIKPQNLDVPSFHCLLFGLLGWTISHVSSRSCLIAQAADSGSFSNYLLTEDNQLTADSCQAELVSLMRKHG